MKQYRLLCLGDTQVGCHDETGCERGHAEANRVHTAKGIFRILTEFICVQGGRISVVGVYVASINHYMFGPFFEKGQSMKAGQTPCQAYWPDLLEMVTSGEHSARLLILSKAPADLVAQLLLPLVLAHMGCEVLFHMLLRLV